MSIKPEFAARILSGEKRVEFRKQAFREDVSHMVIYSTTPVGAIVGVCEVDGVFVATPSTVWRKYAAVAGIARAGFTAYYTNRRRAVAIKVAKPVRFTSPVPLSSIGERRPPQSFRYLPAVSLDRLYAAAHLRARHGSAPAMRLAASTSRSAV
jgi:predicted transcriptional regulator